MINLTYRYVFWGHGGAVIVGDSPEVSVVPYSAQPSTTSGSRPQ
jgi:hypothetical protein